MNGQDGTLDMSKATEYRLAFEASRTVRCCDSTAEYLATLVMRAATITEPLEPNDATIAALVAHGRDIPAFQMHNHVTGSHLQHNDDSEDYGDVAVMDRPELPAVTESRCTVCNGLLLNNETDICKVCVSYRIAEIERQAKKAIAKPKDYKPLPPLPTVTPTPKQETPKKPFNPDADIDVKW